jgi:lysophospholipase L1-like esterase
MSFTRRNLFARGMGAVLLGAGAGAALAAEPAAKPASRVPPALEPERLLSDWAWLARYRDDNARILASGEKVDAVFMGDSITEGWRNAQPDFFTNGRVCRGISAQTTPQMLVRFHADVIALKPRVVHIMAGTNDIAGNTGPMTAVDSKRNLAAMAEIAKSHGIKVVLASIPPAANYPWRPGLETAKAIESLNAWIDVYAKSVGAVYCNYHAAMSNGRGGMKPGLSTDEVHPTAAGYAVMRPLAEASL